MVHRPAKRSAALRHISAKDRIKRCNCQAKCCLLTSHKRFNNAEKVAWIAMHHAANSSAAIGSDHPVAASFLPVFPPAMAGLASPAACRFPGVSYEDGFSATARILFARDLDLSYLMESLEERIFDFKDPAMSSSPLSKISITISSNSRCGDLQNSLGRRLSKNSANVMSSGSMNFLIVSIEGLLWLFSNALTVLLGSPKKVATFPALGNPFKIRSSLNR